MGDKGTLPKRPNSAVIPLMEAISHACGMFDAGCRVLLWSNGHWQQLFSGFSPVSEPEECPVGQLLHQLQQQCLPISEPGYIESEFEIQFPGDETTMLRTFVQQLEDCVIVVVLSCGPNRLSFDERDSLTGLPGRTTLLSALNKLLDGGSKRSDFALLFIDLNGFKRVNDSHGHLIGDAALKEVAARLSTSVRSGDLITRFGGDEFVAIIHGLGSDEALRKVIERIHLSLELPIKLAELTLEVSASIGVALSSEDWTSPEEMLAAADRRMYRSKSGDLA